MLIIKNGIIEFFDKKKNNYSEDINKSLIANSSLKSFEYTLFTTPLQNEDKKCVIEKSAISINKNKKQKLLINLDYYFGIIVGSLGNLYLSYL